MDRQYPHTLYLLRSPVACFRGVPHLCLLNIINFYYFSYGLDVVHPIAIRNPTISIVDPGLRHSYQSQFEFDTVQTLIKINSLRVQLRTQIDVETNDNNSQYPRIGLSPS